jgi:hypothetical protein
MHKICIIGIYFGKFPVYFPLWLDSCKYNPTIDFLIITDQKIKHIPPNVKKINMSFQEFKTLAQSKFDFPISMERPYKICDYRPAFGEICSEYIKDYDFWGHCDFDMVFGDLRNFFTADILNVYDKILNLGHLSLYRNTYECNNRYKLNGSLVGDYKKIFTTDKGYAFDEVRGIYQIYKTNNFPVFDKRIFADISAIYKRFRLALNDINYKDQIFSFEEGKVYREYYLDNKYNKEEFVYLHIKKPKDLQIKFDINNTKRYYITNAGFFSKEDDADLATIRKYNTYKRFLYEEFEKQKYYFTNKWRSLINKAKRL